MRTTRRRRRAVLAAATASGLLLAVAGCRAGDGRDSGLVGTWFTASAAPGAGGATAKAMRVVVRRTDDPPALVLGQLAHVASSREDRVRLGISVSGAAADAPMVARRLEIAVDGEVVAVLDLLREQPSTHAGRLVRISTFLLEPDLLESMASASRIRWVVNPGAEAVAIDLARTEREAVARFAAAVLPELD